MYSVNILNVIYSLGSNKYNNQHKKFENLEEQEKGKLYVMVSGERFYIGLVKDDNIRINNTEYKFIQRDKEYHISIETK